MRGISSCLTTLKLGHWFFCCTFDMCTFLYVCVLCTSIKSFLKNVLGIPAFPKGPAWPPGQLGVLSRPVSATFPLHSSCSGTFSAPAPNMRPALGCTAPCKVQSSALSASLSAWPCLDVWPSLALPQFLWIKCSPSHYIFTWEKYLQTLIILDSQILTSSQGSGLEETSCSPNRQVRHISSSSFPSLLSCP